MAFNNQCAWTLTVTYNGRASTVTYPLTCEFNIERSCYAASKFATFNIYNLSPATRRSEFFRHDLFEKGKTKIVEFSAGYYGGMITCFRGVITEANSVRRGTETVTTIQAADLGTSGTNTIQLCETFKAGTTFLEAFESIASKLSYIQPTTIGVLDGTFQTDTTFYGTPIQILNQISNNHAFVDNSELKMLNTNECSAEDIYLLDAEHGLIDVPQVSEQWLIVKTIFNPSIIPGQRIQVKSTSNDYYNGIYKVNGINHQGTISGAISSQRITTLRLTLFESLPNSNRNITNQTELQGPKIVKNREVYSPDKPMVENVYKYIRNNNGAIPPWNINNMISWYNMIGNENNDSERYSELTPEILANCVVIANKLKNYIDSSSLKGQNILVTSGWRSLRVNRKYSKSSESRHRYGQAIDFIFTSTNTQVAFNNVFKQTWTGFTYQFVVNGGYYIHVQQGPGKGGALR